MPEETYEFNDDSYDAVAAAGLDVVAVLAVLYGHPVHRQYFGSDALVVTGRVPDGPVVSVGLLELPRRSDVYRVVEVMVLSPERAEQVEKRWEGEV